MSEKARLRAIRRVVARQISRVNLRRRDFIGGREAFEVGGGEVVLKMRGPHDVMRRRDVGEKLARVVDVEFVGIEAAPPVAARGLSAAVREDFRAERIVERFVLALERDDLRNRARHLLHGFPRAVGAAVVIDADAVAPARAFGEEVADDVAFVFDQADAVNAHGISGGRRRVSRRRRNRVCDR